MYKREGILHKRNYVELLSVKPMISKFLNKTLTVNQKKWTFWFRTTEHRMCVMKRFPRVCRKIWKANKKSEIETESRKSKLFLRHRTSWFRLPECEKDVVRYTEGPLATSFFHFSPKALRLFLESSFSWPQAEAEPLTQNLASVLGYDALSQKNKEQN